MIGYTTLQKMGEEAYDNFYVGENMNTGEKVIIRKCFDKKVGNKEIKILKLLSSPNISTPTDVISTEKGINIIFEYQKTNLYNYIRSNKKALDNVTIKILSYQLLCGLAHIHDKGIIHRNICPWTCLIGNKGVLKISQFEFSKIINNSESHSFSPDFIHLWYRPPEMLLGSTNYDCLVDVWSAGCIISEMLRGKVLFNAYSVKEQINEIFKVFGTPSKENYPWLASFPKHVGLFKKQNLEYVFKTDDPLLIDLLSKLLEINPLDRITARDALSHPYFDDISPEIAMNFYPA